jgi:hypothetical protein
MAQVLIFSQFKMMLDVLEDYLAASDYPFERIDGMWQCGVAMQSLMLASAGMLLCAQRMLHAYVEDCSCNEQSSSSHIRFLMCFGVTAMFVVNNVLLLCVLCNQVTPTTRTARQP